MALTDVYASPLTAKQAAHLMRRVTFGPSPQQIKALTGLSASAAVDQLLNVPTSPPAPPVDNTTGKTFVDQPFGQDTQGRWQQNTKMWMLGLMVTDNTALEKLTLFWQNHFVVAFSTVNDARFMYRYAAMLRKNALGNFRNFVIDVTKDAAMIRYLNSNQNTKNAPNENYARELQELFTIGVRKPNGSANYDENDIKAAAKVLTGWNSTGYRNETTADITVVFNANNHDTTDKQFSAFYQNAVIKGRTGATAGDLEMAELVDLILKQDETARNIVRELYRWYFNADITAEVEQNFVVPMGALFKRNNYEIKPLLAAMLKSQHFFDNNLRGAVIKSPIELIVGTLRHFGLTPPDPSKDPAAWAQYTQFVQVNSNLQQQDVLNQPTVFGWRPYYDTDFYQIWISSSTLGLRGRSTDNLVDGTQRVGTGRLAIDSIAYVRAVVSDPSDPEKLVKEVAATLLTVDLSTEQLDFLIDKVFLPGLPRYEWYPDWQDYLKNPNNATFRTPVKMKLDNLLKFMLRMAEYQLA